ncbi:uncharacterized protein A4U43_C09F12250 [Asparagus officinalis]|uniref:EF-hand domain-containing protein n=1 Tax=Asparagus officinalis TaxID=4686 RepID=A0A5P1EBX5_ASPOF|nr:calcium-dependent protein kinase 27-like [Asparagus officinalis]ONK58416.1 uncharacterized protein A4U43_C09F12250 [Asparagus officinalis]
MFRRCHPPSTLSSCHCLAPHFMPEPSLSSDITVHPRRYEREAPDLSGAQEVIAESLSEDEIVGLKEMLKMMDTADSGQITYEELKVGLERAGANLKESEISALMEAGANLKESNMFI